MTTGSGPSSLLSPRTVRDGRDAVRNLRRLGLAVLSVCLSGYLAIVVPLSRNWSLMALIAALAVIPVVGMFGISVRSRRAALKVRQLGLICPACGAPLLDARGEITARDAFCAACGQVALAPEESATPVGDRLPTQREFGIRVDEWFIAVGDANDDVKLVGGIAFVLCVAWLLARSVLPEWTAVIAVGVLAVPIVLHSVRESRRRRWAEEVGLYCACGVLLVEPGGAGLSRGVNPAMADIDRSRKTGTCWKCGRRVWRPETPS